MKMATEKQIAFFLKLYPRYVKQLKQEYRYYNKDYTISFVNTVKQYIDNNEPIQMKHISVAIDDMKLVLNLK